MLRYQSLIRYTLLQKQVCLSFRVHRSIALRSHLLCYNNNNNNNNARKNLTSAIAQDLQRHLSSDSVMIQLL